MNTVEGLPKEQCFGCESCKQACPYEAIYMLRDSEGFYYPKINQSLCISCKKCLTVCPSIHIPTRYSSDKIVFGGHIKDPIALDNSTSGGAFTAIVLGWCDSQTVIFGATSLGLKVKHDYIIGPTNIAKFQKSKYARSEIGDCFKKAQNFLDSGCKVLFSGTPCQISGLKAFLKKTYENLLTIEVICEGIPSELYIESFDRHIFDKYGAHISTIDYRYKNKKWDFQIMKLTLETGKILQKDRWFNPFWSLWLKHLMSRPSCYKCPFTNNFREADITLGDLWGVHIYCPELYNNNLGASLVICNTNQGKSALRQSIDHLVGHNLDFNDALKYQSPLRKSIENNNKRDEFLKDLHNLGYNELIKKWHSPPTLKLLYSKYVWGNRQKMFVWNLKKRK